MQGRAPGSEKEAEALRRLAELGRERDMLHGLFARGARHFSAAEADTSDPVELWGRRIGRALGAATFVGFCVYLYFTYVH